MAALSVIIPCIGFFLLGLAIGHDRGRRVRFTSRSHGLYSERCGLSEADKLELRRIAAYGDQVTF